MQDSKKDTDVYSGLLDSEGEGEGEGEGTGGLKHPRNVGASEESKSL